MIIYFSDIYQDILNRAGEGYAAYTDRARAMFWRALASIVQKGEYAQHEVTSITTVNQAAYPLSSFPIPIYAPPNMLLLHTEHFLYVDHPRVHTTQTEHKLLDTQTTYMIRMSRGMGTIEVVWAQTPTHIAVRYNRDIPGIAEAIATIKTIMIGIEPEYMHEDADTAEVKPVLHETLVYRAIEIATQMIIQELRG